MRLQVLLSAMNLKTEAYIDTLNITSDAVVVNQTKAQKEASENTAAQSDGSGEILSIERIRRENINGEKQEVVFIESSERGLSRSRNMAIQNATADICILCDNDVEYVPGYDRLILKAFEKNKDADLIVFFIKRKERSAPIFKTERKMGYLSVLKIFSPEIAFRRESVKDIPFHPLFGAGARYFMGEENLFLYECLKRKKKILYVPVQLAELREEESSWFQGYDKRFFVSRGANYAAMSRRFSTLLILQFAIRKRKLYDRETSFQNALKYMLDGKQEYLRSL
ncbi:MAG: glycosyltransferase family 2 protein [Lachnospiraceae bacterium]|nr:glycosyltransferase family 2 protein [Lachnospiraceae bacterium]